MKAHKYTDTENKFFLEYVPGHSYREIAVAFKEKFKEELTISQIKSYIGRKKLNTGRNGRFEKGHEPVNKGMKGVCAKGCEKTWFKKGYEPINHRPVGSEKITKDGYIKIKVAEPNKWRFKHIVVWEQLNGQIPKGYVVILLDRDKTNVDISNLKLISRSELLIMNRYNMLKDDPSINDTVTNLAKLIDATNKAKRA